MDINPGAVGVGLVQVNVVVEDGRRAAIVDAAAAQPTSGRVVVDEVVTDERTAVPIGDVNAGAVGGTAVLDVEVFDGRANVFADGDDAADIAAIQRGGVKRVRVRAPRA